MEEIDIRKGKKIAVIGMIGAGKSSFSKRLASKLNLPLFHLDRIFWEDNWVPIPESKYLPEHAKLISNDTWILEGAVDKTMCNRFEASDLIIYLDYSKFLCSWRYIKRFLMHRKNPRPELFENMQEKFRFKHLWRIINGEERNQVENSLKNINESKIIRLKNNKQADEFLNKI